MIEACISLRVQVLISASGSAVNPVRFYATSSRLYTRSSSRYAEGAQWTLTQRLGNPPRVQDNVEMEIVITGLHWGNAVRGILIASYRYHGIQYVTVHSYCSWITSPPKHLGCPERIGRQHPFQPVELAVSDVSTYYAPGY